METGRIGAILASAVGFTTLFSTAAFGQSISSVKITDHNGQDYDWQIDNLESYPLKVSYKSVGNFVTTVTIPAKGQIDSGVQIDASKVTIISVAKGQ
jgi:hypothetical protein